MKIRPLDETTLAYHRERILSLDETTPAQWGGMDATRMVSHLRAVMRVSLGEIEVKQFVPVAIGRPLGLLFFYVLSTWPRGKPGSTPPIAALCPAAHGAFEQERQLLLDAMERFVARRTAEPLAKTRHPFTGMTAMQRWSRIHGVHNRHHYRQFGLV